MSHSRRNSNTQSLFVLLQECIELLQQDVLQLKSTRDTKSIRKWTAALRCAVACRKIIQTIENNELDKMEANMHACQIACKRCILYCYTSDLFSNSYKAASKILSQLRLYSNKSTA